MTTRFNYFFALLMCCSATLWAQGTDPVKGFKKFDGFFPFYYDATQDRIFLEMNHLSEEVLYFSSLPGGLGNGIAERGKARSKLVKFVRTGNKVLLVEPNLQYRAISDNPDEQIAVDNAFPQSVIWGFKALVSTDGKIYVDLTPFLIQDSQNLAQSISKIAGGTYKFEESRSALEWSHIGNFPNNTEFESLATFTGGVAPQGPFASGGNIAPDQTSITVKMHQSFAKLPEKGFKMRKFDPRSGFNLFSYYDFSAGMEKPLVARFSRRQRLEKQNPGAAPSKVKEPIVYYVDRGAPAEIKKALIDGGNWWNQAFTAAGFIDGFQVKELPAGADPMDIRYNMVNWVDRAGESRGYSYGSSYIDPRTGEIIKGVVTLGSDRHRQDYLIAEGLLQPYHGNETGVAKLKELTLARIRQLSAHEIGHTLGLYHNFSASIKGRTSVMDYPAPYYTMDAKGNIDVSQAYATGIGEWDKRAITWGYGEFDTGTDENKALDKVMDETLKQGFIQIPDEGGNVHPLAHVWDNGSEPLAELDRLMKIRATVLGKLSENAIQKDAPMATLQEVLVPVYLMHRYQLLAVSKYIGGLDYTFALKGDGQKMTELIAPDKQTQALGLLLKSLQPAELAIPEKLIASIPPRPAGYSSTVELFKSNTGTPFDPLAAAESLASTTLSQILDPERAARLTEYSARDSKQPGFLKVIDQLFIQTFYNKIGTGMDAQLRILVNNLTLHYLFALASQDDVPANVKGQARLKINELAAWLKLHSDEGDQQSQSSRLQLLVEIEAFKEKPTEYKTLPKIQIPPGAPIGMDGMF